VLAPVLSLQILQMPMICRFKAFIHHAMLHALLGRVPLFALPLL
jgi:hypothetical protein